MATTLTRNLKLRLDSNLTANAQYNLLRIDDLGSTFLVDTTNNLNIRSLTDIVIEPQSADLGGSGVGGSVSIGTPSHQISNLNLYISNFNLSSNLGLLDQATSGTKYLRLQYNSTLNSSLDLASDRSLTIDVDGADRQLILGGNLSILGGALALNLSGSSSVSLPLTGTLSTLAGIETLTNKAINAASNTITGLTTSNLSLSAGVTYGQLVLTGSVTNADISSSASIAYNKLVLSNSIQDSDINSGAAIQRSKLASGLGNAVIINTGPGVMTEELHLAAVRGGTGQDNSLLTWPGIGLVLSDSNNATLTNKSISGSSNTLSNIPYSSLHLTGSITNTDISSSAAIAYSKLNLATSIQGTDIAAGAAIAYSKLNLTAGIINSDVSNSAAIAYSKLNLSGSIVDTDISGIAAIQGTKILANFGNQLLITDAGVEFMVGGYSTKWRSAPSAQVTNIDFRLPPSAGTPGQILSTDGTGSLNWVNNAAGGGNVNSYSTLWANSNGQTKTIMHNLGSVAVEVSIIDLDDNTLIQVDSVVVTDGNTLSLSASEAPNTNWRVVVQA